MKKYAMFLISFIVFASSVWGAEMGLHETGEAWLKAFLANDLEGVMATYADDAHLFPPDAVEAVGKEAIRANYAGMFDTFTVKEAKLVDAHHEVVGDVAFGWGRFSIILVPKAGGDPISMEGRFSDVTRKTNGKWLYVVDHASLNPPPPPAQ